MNVFHEESSLLEIDDRQQESDSKEETDFDCRAIGK